MVYCIDAKRVLSADTVADVRVVFPGLSTSVRVNRKEFEDRIRPRLVETLSAFQAAIDSAGVEPEALSRILLVGGSSRIPLVSALLAQRFGRPLAVDSDPKNTVALGAARFGSASHTIAPPVSPLEAPTPAPSTPSAPSAAPSTPSAPTPPPRAPSRPVKAVDAVPMPSTESATSRSSAASRQSEPGAPTPPEPTEPESELFSVRAESRHRTRMPQATDRAPEPPEPTSAATEAVGIDPKLFIVAAVVVLVVAAVVAIALLSG